MPIVVRKGGTARYTTPTGIRRTKPHVLTQRERAAAQALAAALRGLRGNILSIGVQDALSRGDADAVVDAFDWAGFYTDLAPLRDLMLGEAGEAARRALGALAKELGVTLRTGFDLTDPKAVAWSQVKTGELVTQVTETTRTTIRQIVSEAFTNQISVTETEQRLRQVIGLLPNHATAVLRFQERTLADLLTTMGREQALERTELLTGRYYNRLLRYRSRMIARTEIMHSSNMGRLLGWAEASEQGLLAGVKMRKKWVTAPKGSQYGPPCEVCWPMNGRTVTWDEPFDVDGRKILMPPAHPHCRCTAVADVPTVEEIRQASAVAAPQAEPQDWAWVEPQSQGLLFDALAGRVTS